MSCFEIKQSLAYSEGAGARAPSRSNFFHFQIVFGTILSNNRFSGVVASIPVWEILDLLPAITQDAIKLESRDPLLWFVTVNSDELNNWWLSAIKWWVIGPNFECLKCFTQIIEFVFRITAQGVGGVQAPLTHDKVLNSEGNKIINDSVLTFHCDRELVFLILRNKLVAWSHMITVLNYNW